MKIRVIRASGNPVDPEQAKKYQDEWKEGFDKLTEKHGKFGPEIQAALDEYEKKLELDYKDLTIANWEFPKSKKAWIDKLSEYGNILVTTNIENGELIFVVQDMPF